MAYNKEINIRTKANILIDALTDKSNIDMQSPSVLQLVELYKKLGLDVNTDITKLTCGSLFLYTKGKTPLIYVYLGDRVKPTDKTADIYKQSKPLYYFLNDRDEKKMSILFTPNQYTMKTVVGLGIKSPNINGGEYKDMIDKAKLGVDIKEGLEDYSRPINRLSNLVKAEARYVRPDTKIEHITDIGSSDQLFNISTVKLDYNITKRFLVVNFLLIKKYDYKGLEDQVIDKMSVAFDVIIDTKKNKIVAILGVSKELVKKSDKLFIDYTYDDNREFSNVFSYQEGYLDYTGSNASLILCGAYEIN